MVWRLCPKEQNQNFRNVYGSAILAAAEYNDGMTGMLETLSKINFPVDHIKHLSQALEKDKFNNSSKKSKSKKPTQSEEREYVYGGDELDW